MTDSFRLGIIGFGEVGYNMALGLGSEGLKGIKVFDLLLVQNPDNKLLNERIAETGVKTCVSLEELVENSDIIFSTVTAGPAVKVAKEAVKYIQDHHLYVDLNSTSNRIQEEINNMFVDKKARFVDAAIMASIAARGYKAPIVASGEGREEFKKAFEPYGMNINSKLAETAGEASAFKMFRSIFAKGIEALLVETLVSAYNYNIGEQVLDSICEFIDAQEFRALTNTLVTTHAIHAGRRAVEMDNVCQTVEGVGIEPIMSAASRAVLKRTEELETKEYFEGRVPESFKEVVDYLRKNL